LTQGWRLVNGSELYNLADDPGQGRDVATDHPQRVSSTREAYEAWWASLEPSLERYGRIVVGDPGENPSELTCMDWHAELPDIPWDQTLIDRMTASNGYWMIDVARAGRYEFVLRHKPVAAAFPLQATRARVRVGDVHVDTAVSFGATDVRLTLDLPAGPARLDTWLIDERQQESRGAFFVEVRRLERS
jgi:hypothetical protein